MKKIILLTVLALILCGCKTTGTKIRIDRSAALTGLEQNHEYFPELNRIVVVTPGESLIYSYLVTKRKGIRLLETIRHNGKFNGFTNTYIVEAGDLTMMAKIAQEFFMVVK